MTDPFDDRRRGLRRVHAVTATVAAGALLGTGGVVVTLASADRASAADPTVQQVPDDDGGGLTPPQQLPQPAPGDPGHASSGGS